ncbi:APC family permease [Castellaniella caeni]|uniref:APC family permease n=1 Tax=Castellaniella caeni TaxID=266123 RepID=UPI00082D7FC7|nr:APC family permease [Castellaniella caeni]
MTSQTIVTRAATTPAPSTKLARNRLGTFAIFFLVVSAAAPLTVIVNSGIFYHFGGIGAPGAMLFAGITLILFSLGLTAMSHHVKNAGAFYAYAAKGLGKPIGVGIASVATFSYAVLTIAFFTWLGFYAAQSGRDLLGVDISWGVYALVGIAIAGALGYRNVDIGAKVIAVLLTCEITLMVVLAIAVLIQVGPAQVIWTPFAPEHVFFAHGAGSLFIVGFGSYVGFEGTVIYAEEAKDPDKSVARATFLAVAFLAVLYAFLMWILVVAFGADGLLKIVNGSDFGADLAFDAAHQYLGRTAVVIMHILIVTSWFACAFSFHNACARYFYAMGREGLLPRILSHTHHEMQSPHHASLLITAIAGIATVISLVFGLDPFTQTSIWAYSCGVVGVVFAQGVASLASVGYFTRVSHHFSKWRVIVAPALGALGLFIGVYLIISNFSIVSGLEGAVNWIFIGATPLFFFGGLIAGYMIKWFAPDKYRKLAEIEID